MDMTDQDFETESQKAQRLAQRAEAIKELPPDINYLTMNQLIGFNGAVKFGLLVHVGGEHLIYPVGNTVVVEEIPKKGVVGKQDVLSGHSDSVTCLCQSTDGRFLASGQVITPGWKAPVIMWDFASRTKIMEYPLHKVKVETLIFNKSNECLISLGGYEDTQVTVWSVTRKEPLCGKGSQRVTSGMTKVLAASKADANVFISAGDDNGRIWTVDTGERTMTSRDMNFGPVHRNIICVEICDADSLNWAMAFCGTTSGDILIFNMHTGIFQAMVPNKDPLPRGVTAMAYVRMLDDTTFNMLVGTGEGHVCNYNITLSRKSHKELTAKAVYAKDTTMWKNEKDKEPVTSIAKVKHGQQFYVGLQSDHIYMFNLHQLKSQLFRTGSRHAVLALTFARGTDDLILTGSFEQVRVYNLQVGVEVRRYVRANRTCHSVTVNHDGTQVFTGWDDGGIIVLGFQQKDFSFHELFRIHVAQRQPVTAMALTSQSAVLISACKDGQMSIWRLVDDLDMRGRRLRQALQLRVLDAHGPVTCLQVSKDDKTFICGSGEGSVGMYEIVSGACRCVMRVGSHVTRASFCCDEQQVLAATQAGFIRQFEVLENYAIRELDGDGKYGAVNALSVLDAKKVFGTGGHDAIVKLWGVETGAVSHVGLGHSKPILQLNIGPCGTRMVSGGADGSLIVWAMP